VNESADNRSGRPEREIGGVDARIADFPNLDRDAIGLRVGTL